ncbi:MAG: ACP S-malonyltransferase [Candidatus Margulisiibacteriota bacterium]
MKRYAVVFPGQGSQSVGMGQTILEAYPDTNRFFEEAEAVLKTPLKAICLEGPAETLTQTANAQPGIFTVSMALFSLLKAAGLTPAYVAGHSLGEITAYVAADVLSLKDGLTVIAARGAAMAAAHPSDRSAMAAVMGMDFDALASILAPFQAEPVVMANINSPGQIVISGEKDGVTRAIDAIKAQGAKVIPLNVSGAFHSPLMKPASEALESAIAPLDFHNAAFPIVLNRSAQPETEAEALKANLPLQVISSVDWVGTLKTLADKVDAFIECGPGKVLTGLIKKTVPDKPVVTVSDKDSLDAFLASDWR